ncbi:MAG TPA: hypothetical protein VFK06_13910 [Candidatus Angelobacter sp.]|nr:hypothetical protein [Candidatus Angelobacter sp.]
MTINEQDAVMGKALRDLKTAQLKLKELQLECSKLGKQFSYLGEILSNNPEYAGLNTESMMDSKIAPLDQRAIFDRNIFDADKFKQLTHDLRETMGEVNYLVLKLKS